jgi:hypothetical protein
MDRKQLPSTVAPEHYDLFIRLLRQTSARRCHASFFVYSTKGNGRRSYQSRNMVSRARRCSQRPD